MQGLKQQEWNVIKPKTSLFQLNLQELFHYWDLVVLFVKRDFVVQYKQTILGPLWFFIQPIFTTLIFTVIFGNIANISTDGLPQVLFYMAGVTLWNYFSTCLTETSSTFIRNAGIFGKVYFPRLTVPLSTVITKIFTFLIQFGLFIGVWIYFLIKGSAVHPNWLILLTPLLLLHMAALGMGVGIWVSSLTTKYRDLTFLVTFGVQLWMYATPIVYPMSIIPEKWRVFAILNPMSPIVEFFRLAFLGQGYFNWAIYGISIIGTLIILLTGIVIFNKVEKDFMDIV